jgi:hypothetical protein
VVSLGLGDDPVERVRKRCPDQVWTWYLPKCSISLMRSRLQGMMSTRTSWHDTVLRQSEGCIIGLAWHRCSAQYIRRTLCGTRAARSEGRRPHIPLSNTTSWPSCATRLHTWVTRGQAHGWALRAGRSGVDARTGPRALVPWPMPQDGAARPMFPRWTRPWSRP